MRKDVWTPETGSHSYVAYKNHKCRCDVCRAANAEYQRAIAAKRKEALATNPNIVHGKRTVYSNYGCRCEPCSVAWKIAGAAYKKRRKAEKGTQ